MVKKKPKTESEAAIVDITEHRLMEEELRRVHEALEMRVRERTSELAEVNIKLRAEIEERERAEDRIKELMASVQEEKDRLSALVKSIPDEVWFADAKHNIVLVNPAVLKAFGGDTFDNPEVESIAGNAEVYRPDGTARPVEEAPPLRALRGEQVRDQEEIVRIPASGELRVRQVNASPVMDAAGNIIGSVAVVRDITERKKMEDALAESEEKYRGLFDSAGDAVITIDLEDGITSWNTSAERLFGYTSKEAVGKKLTDLTIPVDKIAERDTIVRDALAGKDIADLETTGLRKDGSRIEVSLTISPIMHAGGEIIGLSGMLRDITERKRAEEALQKAHDDLELRVQERTAELKEADNSSLESKARYRELAESIGDVFYAMDRNLIYTYWNNASELLTGIMATDAIGKSIFELFPELRGSRVEKLYREVIKTREPRHFVNKYHAGGKDLFFEVNAYPSGFGLSVIAKDITGRRRAEEAAKAERQRFNDILDVLPAYVVLLTPDYHVPFANRFFQERFGESHGRRCFEYLFGRSEPCETCETYTVLKTSAPHHWEWTGPDGRNYDIYDFPFADRDGSALILEMGIDITERKQAEEKLKESLKEKEILLKEIHHRVKNNMQVISSLLMLQEDSSDDNKIIEMLKDSQNRISSMALIHERLYLSWNLSKVDIKEYVEDLVSGLFQSYGVNESRVALNTNLENISLGIDSAIPCGLVISELVSNSLKYAFPENKKGEINISLRLTDENMIELLVSDNGTGIPEDMDIRKTRSLGLYLVTLLVEKQLHGEITLNRKNGAEFLMRFPREMK